MIVEIESFQHVCGEQIDTTITRPANGPVKGKILFLHGAGESTKDRCLPMVRELSAMDWECLTFSFPGHGASSGTLLGSTLKGRREVTLKLAEKLDFLSVDRVVAVSMGAHTALSLLKDYPNLTTHLVLLVPAMYAKAAENVPFGPAFSEVLRTPGSYLTAETWEFVPQYRGELAIVQAGGDTVIPSVIMDKLHQEATAAKRVVRSLVADSPHRITTWMAEEQERVRAFSDAINDFDFSILNRYATSELPV